MAIKYSPRIDTSNLLNLDYYNGSSWSTPFVLDGANGRFGIGATPGYPLTVTRSAGADYAAYFTNSAAAGSSYGLNIDAGGNSSDWALQLRDRSGAVYFMRVLGDGTIGVPTGPIVVGAYTGTVGANAKLELFDSTTRPNIWISGKADGASAGYGTVRFNNSSGTQRGAIVSVMDAGSNTLFEIIADGRTGGGNAVINFFTAPNGGSLTEKMRIDHLGNVGIGTTTIPSMLTVAGLINMKNYTVATLPAGTQGDIAYVTDGLAPAFLTAIVGGGAVVTPVFYDGTNWVAM